MHTSSWASRHGPGHSLPTHGSSASSRGSTLRRAAGRCLLGSTARHGSSSSFTSRTPSCSHIALGTDRGLGRVRLTGLLLGFAGTVLIFAPCQRSGLIGRGALALQATAASYPVTFAYMVRRLTVGQAPPRPSRRRS
jgi:hypothetical protein